MLTVELFLVILILSHQSKLHTAVVLAVVLIVALLLWVAIVRL